MAQSGRAAVAVLAVGVLGAITAAAVYPVFLATERPAQAGERSSRTGEQMRKKSE